MTVKVLHVGVVGPFPGGMAQVVNEYLSWDFDGFELEGLASTAGRRDPLAVFRWLRSAWVILFRSITHRGNIVTSFHLSERGSFIREGSLVLLANLLGLPVAVHLHGAEFPAFAAKHARIVRLVCGSADAVFVLTDETADVLDRLHTARTSRSTKPRVVRLANAVKIPPAPVTKDKTVLFGGEVGLRKGADVLVEAWAKLPEKTKAEWRLLLVGPLRMDFGTDVLEPSIEVMGAVPRAELAEYQNRAAVAVLPSRHEALPMFLIESMAHGCATVATPVGQVSELLEGGTGVLVPVADSGKLSDALLDLTENSAERKRLGSAARQRVSAHYSEEVVRRVLVAEWKRIGGRA
jgi:glycosyltransferase involved in cell wall biosynthesis